MCYLADLAITRNIHIHKAKNISVAVKIQINAPDSWYIAPRVNHRIHKVVVTAASANI